MTEQALQDYFNRKTSAMELSRDVVGSRVRTSHDVTSIKVIPMAGPDEFMVMRQHMLMLCNDAINGDLSIEDLEVIAFALVTSEHFTLNDGTIDGQVVSDTAFDWDNSEIGYPLTMENLKRWKARLETGADLFDPNEIKRRPSKR